MMVAEPLRVFTGSTLEEHRIAQWRSTTVELRSLTLYEPATSMLLVGSHVLLGTISGGGRAVHIETEGTSDWTGPKFPGAAGFVPAGRRMTSHWPVGELSYIMLLANSEATNELLGHCTSSAEWQSRASAEDQFISTGLQRLARAMRDEADPLANLLAESVTTALHLHATMRFGGQSPAPSGDDGGVARAIDLIHSRFPASVSLASMADESRLPKGRFLAAFRARTGMTPHRYILEERFARASLILKTTNRSLDEVAIEVGCANAGHLAKIFKRKVGISPAAWRHGCR